MNKSDFEIKAMFAGASQKEMLDFESAFKTVAGYPIESPLIDETFLKSQGLQTAVACRALLAPKLSMDSINKIVDVFESYC